LPGLILQGMNKILAFVAMLLLTGLSGLSVLKAQDTGITVNITNATAADNADGKVEITIDEGTPSFTVYLFDKAPWKGGRELRRQENVSNRYVSFDKLLSGSYYVIVEDTDKNPSAMAVMVGIISNN